MFFTMNLSSGAPCPAAPMKVPDPGLLGLMEITSKVGSGPVVRRTCPAGAVSCTRPKAECDRTGHSDYCTGGEHQLFRHPEIGGVTEHDGSNAPAQICTSDPRNVWEWNLRAESADFQKTFGIDFGSATDPNDRLVARALAFLKQLPLNPPHKRMEPEDCFDDHVKRSSEVVAMLHVRHLVRQNRIEMCVFQLGGELCRPEHHGMKYAVDAGLHHVA